MNQVIQPDKLMVLVEGDAEFLGEMITAQVQTLEELQASFRKEVEAGNLEGLRSANHKAKPAMELLGAAGLMDLIGEAYTLLDTGADDAAKAKLIAQFDELSNQVIEATRQITV